MIPTESDEFLKIKKWNRRFPRKAKKWANKQSLRLISVHGRCIWWAETIGTSKFKRHTQ